VIIYSGGLEIEVYLRELTIPSFDRTKLIVLGKDKLQGAHSQGALVDLNIQISKNVMHKKFECSGLIKNLMRFMRI
jgi:hypothetical protein